MMTWAVTAVGFHIYKDGQLVGTIPRGHFLKLATRLIKELDNANT